MSEEISAQVDKLKKMDNMRREMVELAQAKKLELNLINNSKQTTQSQVSISLID